MAMRECAVCGNYRILTKCSSCGRRVCANCYVTQYAVCEPCAQAQGLHHRHRIFRAMT